MENLKPAFPRLVVKIREKVKCLFSAWHSAWLANSRYSINGGCKSPISPFASAGGLGGGASTCHKAKSDTLCGFTENAIQGNLGYSSFRSRCIYENLAWLFLNYMFLKKYFKLQSKLRIVYHSNNNRITEYPPLLGNQFIQFECF